MKKPPKKETTPGQQPSFAAATEDKQEPNDQKPKLKENQPQPHTDEKTQQQKITPPDTSTQETIQQKVGRPEADPQATKSQELSPQKPELKETMPPKSDLQNRNNGTPKDAEKTPAQEQKPVPGQQQETSSQETKQQAPQQPIETKEETKITGEQLAAKVAEDFKQKYKIDFEKTKEGELETLGEDYNSLNPGQKLMVLENFKQLLYGRIHDEARAEFRQANPETKLLANIWRGVRNSLSKNYQISKLEEGRAKELLENGGLKVHGPLLQELVKGAKNGPEAFLHKERPHIMFASCSDIEHFFGRELTPDEKNKISDINGGFTGFSYMPLSWSYRESKFGEKRSYKKTTSLFEERIAELTNFLVENNNYSDQKEAVRDINVYIASLRNQIRANQFLNRNPDVEKVLQRIGSEGSKWRELILKDAIIERGGLAIAGFVARTAAITIMLTIGAPVTAGIALGGAGIGAARGAMRGREKLRSEAELARAGEDIRRKREIKHLTEEAKKVPVYNEKGELIEIEEREEKREKDSIADKSDYANADTISAYMDHWLQKLNSPESPEQQQHATKRLKQIVNYAESKLAAGLISYGHEHENAEQIAQRTARGEKHGLSPVEKQIASNFRLAETLTATKANLAAYNPELIREVEEKIQKELNIPVSKTKSEKFVFSREMKRGLEKRQEEIKLYGTKRIAKNVIIGTGLSGGFALGGALLSGLVFGHTAAAAEKFNKGQTVASPKGTIPIPKSVEIAEEVAKAQQGKALLNEKVSSPPMPKPRMPGEYKQESEFWHSWSEDQKPSSEEKDILTTPDETKAEKEALKAVQIGPEELAVPRGEAEKEALNIVTKEIPTTGPQGAIIKTLTENQELARKWGWDGKTDLKTWAGGEAHRTWLKYAHKIMDNPELRAEMEKKIQTTGLKNFKFPDNPVERVRIFTEMARKIAKGADIEINLDNKEMALRDLEYIKVKSIAQAAAQINAPKVQPEPATQTPATPPKISPQELTAAKEAMRDLRKADFAVVAETSYKKFLGEANISKPNVSWEEAGQAGFFDKSGELNTLNKIKLAFYDKHKNDIGTPEAARNFFEIISRAPSRAEEQLNFIEKKGYGTWRGWWEARSIFDISDHLSERVGRNVPYDFVAEHFGYARNLRDIKLQAALMEIFVSDKTRGGAMEKLFGKLNPELYTDKISLAPKNSSMIIKLGVKGNAVPIDVIITNHGEIKVDGHGFRNLPQGAGKFLMFNQDGLAKVVKFLNSKEDGAVAVSL